MIRPSTQSRWVSSVILFGAMVLVGAQVFAQAPRPFESACHTFGPGSAGSAGFGVPWDVFNPSTLTLQAMCANAVGVADVAKVGPATYVYNVGYAWTKDVWTIINFGCTGTASVVNGVWCPTSGSAFLPMDTTYFVAYTCLWYTAGASGGEWKCGCADQACAAHLWQLQGMTPSFVSSGGSESN